MNNSLLNRHHHICKHAKFHCSCFKVERLIFEVQKAGKNGPAQLKNENHVLLRFFSFKKTI